MVCAADARGTLPVFGLSEISGVSGLQALWDSGVALALLITAFALSCPLPQDDLTLRAC